MSEVKWKPLIITVVIGLILWFLPHPEEIKPEAWQLLAIFIATIVGIILKPLPMGAVAIIAMAVTILTKTLSFTDTFCCFSNEVVWLVVLAFFIARGFISTGLGARLGYLFMKLLGKKTLGLGYGMALTELILAPAIPSTTARAGGVIFPILRSLAKAFGSDPNEGTSEKMGTFLTLTAFQVTCITSAMFVTSMAGNPLIVLFAAESGVQISWGLWALAAIVPGLVSLALIPWVIYKLSPPGVRETPHAKEYAEAKLAEMGKIKSQEWTMIGVFILLLLLWIGGPALLGVNATTTALIGLSLLLLTGVLTWKDVLKEDGAWDILIWFAALVMMASNLNKLGLTSWFSQWIVGNVSGFEWMAAFGILAVVYFYTHYFFASNVAHIGAMYPPFLLVAIALGAPPLLVVLVLAFFSSLFGGLTHYGCGPAPILYASGYVSLPKWWKIGAIVSVINILIWFVVGGLWWKLLNLW